MRRAGWVAAVCVAVVALAGCGGSKSVDELVRDRFGADAGSCRAAAATELGKVYSCQNGHGGTTCVTLAEVYGDDGDLFVITPQQAERYRITC